MIYIGYYYKVHGMNVKSDVNIKRFISIEETDNIDIYIKIEQVDKKIKDYIKIGKKKGYSKNSSWFYVKDLGIFLIKEGKEIIVELIKNYSEIKFINYLLGSAFAYAMFQKNVIALHGAGVIINNKAVIILGKCGAGKSTLTNHLIKKGYKFLSDDVCRLNVYRNEINVNPSYPYQKLCKDTIERLQYKEKEYELIDAKRDKYLVKCKNFIDKEIKLGAIIELEEDNTNEVEIYKVNGIKKLNTLVDNIYLESKYKSRGYTKDYMKNCIDVSSKIPIYNMKRPKNIFSINEQIELIEGII